MEAVLKATPLLSKYSAYIPGEFIPDSWLSILSLSKEPYNVSGIEAIREQFKILHDSEEAKKEFSIKYPGQKFPIRKGRKKGCSGSDSYYINSNYTNWLEESFGFIPDDW